MAKKKDDIDLGSEFENWESDLSDLNFDDDTSTNTDSNRSPVTKVRQGITAGLKSTTQSIGPALASKIGSNMPVTSSFVGEAMQFSSDVKALKDNFTKELQPTINTLKKAGRTLAPKFKGYLPNALQLKLDKFLQETEKAKSVSVEDSRNAAIDSQLSLIFAAQEKREQKVLEEEKTDKFVDRTISATRHQELSKVVDAIRVATEFQKEFTSTIGTAYLKKSLELKFKHLFVAQDTLATVQGMAKVMEEKLEIIRHNTALPDTQKQLLSESYKEVAKAALAQRLNTKISGWGGQILSNVKEQILNPVKEGLGMAAFGADMYSTMSEMEDSFGGGTNGAQKVGGIAGGIASNFLVKKVTDKLFGNGLGRGLISPYAQNSENFMENLKVKLMLTAQHAGDNAEDGSFKKFALGLLNPNLRRGAGTIKDDLSDPFEPASFDKATRTSIVEIIPGFLSKILQTTTKMATGKDSEELTYSYDKRDFVTASEFREDVLTRAFGTKEQRGQDLGKAVGALRGSFAHHNDDFATFDDAVGDIKKVLVNAASSNNLIHPKWIKAYADDTPPDSSEYRQYIKDIFKDIEDPKIVSRVLVSTLYLNRSQINQQACSEIDRYVIGLMTKDQYLSILPTYFAKTGQGRFLGDLAKGSAGGFKIDNDFVRQQRLDGTDKAFADNVNSTAKQTKDFLAQDLKDKQESHPLVRKYLEWISGNATHRMFDSMEGRQFDSEFDSFFQDMYNSNMTPGEMEEFLARAGGAPTSGNVPKLIESQAVNVRAPSVKRNKTHAGAGKQTIISGTEIVIPVHLKSSDVKLGVPTTPAVTPKTTTISGSLEQISQTHAERQYPVPDLLQKLVTTSAEMNDKLYALMSNTASTIKGIYHRGRELTKSTWQRIQRISILDSASRARQSLSGAASSVGNWLFEGATTIGAGALGAAGAVAGVPGGIWNGLKGWTDKIKEQGGLMEVAQNRMARTRAGLGGIKDKILSKIDLKFVDVYVHNKVEVGKPLVTAKQQRNGVIFSDGKPVSSSFNIDRPVMDPETNETLITQENIDEGLVDVKNRPLKVKLFGKGGGSLRSKISGMFGIKGKIDSLKEMLTNDKGIIGLIGTVTKGIFGAGGWLGRGIGKGVSTLFNKVTGREGIEVRRQDLKDMVGDKLDLIYQYLKQRFGEGKGPNGDLFPDDDERKRNQHEEYMKKQADQSLALEKERSEKELATLESIDETTKANLVLDAETAKTQAKEQGGGIMGSVMDMLGDTKYGKWAKNLFGKGGAVRAGLGMLKGAGGRMFGGMAARFGIQAGATALLGGGAGAVTGAVGAGAAGTAAAGAGLAATTAAGGAASAGGVAALLASNPIGWAVAGALGVGIAAYAGYKWLNPSGDDLLKQRAEYYGVDLDKSTGFFSGSYSKKVIELEEITAEILQGKERAFSDDDLVNWAEEFEFDPKEKEQVKYFATWYRQRFYPTFRIFLDLVMKAGGTYEGIDDLSEEQREAISMEFQKQVGNNVTEYKDIVPTMEGFNKFYKLYVKTKEKAKHGEGPSEGDKAAIADAAKADRDVTARADKYGLDKDAVMAARQLSFESDSESPTNKEVQSPQERRTAWGQMTGGFGTANTGQEAITPVDTSGYVPQLPKTGELGALSAEYESSSLGSMAIGYDGKGGTSYGMYQIASAPGTFMEFLHWLKRQGPEGAAVADRLYKAGPANTGSKNGSVPNEWRTLVKEGKMKDFEHQFIKATHYDSAFAGLADPEMKAMITSSKALQDVLWSTAVQHGAGKAKTLFNRAWASLQSKTPEAFIKAIYGLRSADFPSSTQAIQQSVKKRFGQEAATAVAMLNKEKSAPDDSAVAATPGGGGSDVAGLAAAESASGTTATTVAQGPVVKSTADSGTDMSPAAISAGPTAPVTTASTTPTEVSTPAVNVPSTPATGGDAAVNQLVRLNAGLEQVNMTLQAILLGQGVLNDINSGIQNGFSGASNAPATKKAVDQTTSPQTSGPKLHTAKSMANLPASISVNRASARSI